MRNGFIVKRKRVSYIYDKNKNKNSLKYNRENFVQNYILQKFYFRFIKKFLIFFRYQILKYNMCI